MRRTRRRLLQRAGGALGAAGLLSVAGCQRSPDVETEPSPSPDGFGQTSAGSPTPTESTGKPTRSTVEPLNGSWPSYRLNASNTAATAEPGPADDPELVWRRETAAGVRPVTDPVAVRNAFCFVMSNGNPTAISADAGRIRWQGDRSVSTDVDPAGRDGTVVFADGDAVLGLSAADGAERWRTALSGSITGLVTGRSVVVITHDEGVTALALADGTEAWDHSVDGTVATRPAVGDGVVAVGLSTGVVGFDADSGDERWRTAVGEGTFAPAVGDGRVYVPAGNRLVAYGASGGERAWTVTTDLPIEAAPVAQGERVYLATMTGDAEPESDRTGTRTATPLPTDARRFAADLVAVSSDGSIRWRSGASGKWNFTSGPPELAMAATDERVFVGVDETLFGYDTADGSGVWTVRAGQRARTPAVLEDVVSTGVVGVAVRDGTERWRFDVGRRVESSPAVADNTVYIGSDDTHLYAVAANSGRLSWRAQTGGQVKSSPAVDDDTVYVGSGDGYLYAFDREVGAERWRFDTGGPVESSPTLRNGSVYVGSRSGSLFAVDAEAGTERWRVQYGDEFLSATPAVAAGVVYAGANDVFRALDAGDGTELWQADVGPTRVLQSVPAVADGRVFVTPGESLLAFDAADGTELWRRQTRGTVVNAPAVRDGTVYTTGGEFVSAFDVASGDLAWRTSVGGAGWVVATGTGVVASGSDGSIVALDHTDGSEQWRLPGVNPTRSPAVVDEYLFVGGYEGGIYAIGPGGN
jgi:outer membrane protein assembly factor BamB